MPEETTTETTETTTTGTPAAPLVNADGILREGWRDTLPEDIRGNKALGRVENFEGAMRSIASAERMIGADKVAVLTEASTDAEQDAFYKAGGRPETAADYNFARPEELPEEHYSQELATAAQELMHKLGLSKKQADALFAFNNDTAIAQLKTQSQDETLAMQTLTDGLVADWGNAYEQRKHLGNKAIEEGTGGNVEFKERLTQKFGNDPDFVRFTSNLGSKFSEAGSPDIPLIPTTGDIQSQIEEAMAHKSHGADYKSHGFTKAQHDAQVQKVTQLYKSMYPEKK